MTKTTIFQYVVNSVSAGKKAAERSLKQSIRFVRQGWRNLVNRAVARKIVSVIAGLFSIWVTWHTFEHALASAMERAIDPGEIAGELPSTTGDAAKFGTWLLAIVVIGGVIRYYLSDSYHVAQGALAGHASWHLYKALKLSWRVGMKALNDLSIRFRAWLDRDDPAD